MTKKGSNARGKASSPIDLFIALPDAEKERIAAEFDKEFVPTRPLTAEQRRLWRKARRKPGRPRVGQGFKVISLSVERGLLRRTDALAKKRRQTRVALVADALHAVLAKAG